MAIQDWGINITGSNAGAPAGQFASLASKPILPAPGSIAPSAPYGPGSAEQARIDTLTGGGGGAAPTPAAGASPASNPNPPGSAAYTAWENARIANLTGGGGASGGNPNYDAQAAAQNAAIARQNAEEQARVASDTSQVNDYLGRYQAAVPGLYDTALSKFNVQPNLDIASALNSRINQLKDYGSLATGGATANTIDAAVNTHLLPSFETATTNANNAVNAAQGYVTAGMQPFQTEGQMLNDRLAREATGMTQAHTNELNDLLGQMTQGVALSTANMKRLTDLADQENQLEMKKLELQSAVELKNAELANSIKTANISAGGSIGAATAGATIGSRYKETSAGVFDTQAPGGPKLISGPPLDPTADITGTNNFGSVSGSSGYDPSQVTKP